MPIVGRKRRASSLTCGECKNTLIWRGVIDQHVKIIPDDWLKNWDDYDFRTKTVTKVFTCPKCKHEAVWEKGTKDLNKQLHREKFGFCTRLQREYR